MPLKVFGGLIFVDYRQVRAVVAASSRKAAAEAVNESLYSFRQYWSETGNKHELAAALSEPGTVFVATSPFSQEYVPFTKNSPKSIEGSQGKQ